MENNRWFWDDNTTNGTFRVVDHEGFTIANDVPTKEIALQIVNNHNKGVK